LKDQPGITKNEFLYNLSRASYQKNWGNEYQPPTLWDNFIAFLTRIVPKIGPLKVLKLQTPTPEAACHWSVRISWVSHGVTLIFIAQKVEHFVFLVLHKNS
jgi:hypothetical protein